MSRLFLLFGLLLAGCGSQAGPAPAPTVASTPAQVQQLSWTLQNTYPHDNQAFTQGLLWHNGYLYESTGLEGQSSLRRVELETGTVIKKVNLPASIFAEGLALANGKLYQLSWQNKIGYIYDINTFERTGQFSYNNEGWGLTYDGTDLIQSDGSATLTWRSTANFAAKKQVQVTRYGAPVGNLNELEWINGKIWANIWTTDKIVVINPQSGKVEAELDLAGLRRSFSPTGSEDVLNGIAYDATNQRLFVTGKNWPKLFQIQVQGITG